jgi:hypothetical protein
MIVIRPPVGLLMLVSAGQVRKRHLGTVRKRDCHTTGSRCDCLLRRGAVADEIERVIGDRGVGNKVLSTSRLRLENIEEVGAGAAVQRIRATSER